MKLNIDAVGAVGERRAITWTSKDSLLYAVGIGAGRDDLKFSTENTMDTTQVVYPTFAVVAGSGAGDQRPPAADLIGEYDLRQLVHGAEAVTVAQPIPASGEAVTQERVLAIYDKGESAVVVIENEATLPAGVPLWTVRHTLFIRGAGGWGGNRGAAGPLNVPPTRPPDVEITLPTSPDQAFVYRLSGDRNPLHTDPSFAALGGFERPILHGLCTYGFTARALLRGLCDNDVTRFHHIEGRFSSPAIAGDNLSVHAWREPDGVVLFTTSVRDRVVIDRGLARIS